MQRDPDCVEDIVFNSFNKIAFYTKCKFREFTLSGIDVIRALDNFFRYVCIPL